MIVPWEIVKGMIDHAVREAPIEACGYLAGPDGGAVKRMYALTNIDARADHFSFDPKEQFAVHKAARQEGFRILAVYHSHPATPARPSEEDIRLAYDPALIYVIVSLAEGEALVRGFRIRQGIVEEEPIIIEENP